MELRQLEYFLECAQRGSLTRAAEALYTTQPHVSQVIRALERELGVALFRRTGSGIVLTEDGGIAGNTDVELTLTPDLVRFQRIRRVTGYLTGSVERWNNAKQAELGDRLKHIGV